MTEPTCPLPLASAIRYRGASLGRLRPQVERWLRRQGWRLETRHGAPGWLDPEDQGLYPFWLALHSQGRREATAMLEQRGWSLVPGAHGDRRWRKIGRRRRWTLLEALRREALDDACRCEDYPGECA